MARIYNFSAGPATLPEEVMLEAQDGLLDWRGHGMSIMEMSHRSKQFIAVAEQAENDLRELLSVPDNYQILFLQGGARSQFAMIPMNLLAGKDTADYFDTGIWSALAIQEAQRFCQVNVVASDKANQYKTVPDVATWQLDNTAAYCHYTDNETVHGVEFGFIPDVEVPLVSDMSSNILSKPLDVSRFGLIYAGAQKNIGPAGLTIVIVRDDLLGHAPNNIPSMFDYQLHAKKDSMLNTPPTFSWYMAGLSFQWLKREGGLGVIAERNQRKAAKLYDYIDSSDFYSNDVDVRYRSRMNVIFNLADESHNEAFLKQALENGLSGLKGHRALGGMRASIYNAMPESGIDALIEFMCEFARSQVAA